MTSKCDKFINSSKDTVEFLGPYGEVIETMVDFQLLNPKNE